jgi:Leucine-rich repeat (LRR) protein
MKKIIFSLSLLCCFNSFAQTWQNQTSNVTDNLQAVFFSDANIGYVVGDNGVILKTTNSGSTWTKETSGTTQDLKAVHGFGTTVMAAGSGGTVLIKTGSTWTKSTGVGSNFDIYDILLKSNSEAYCVGACGTLLKSSNNGSTWSAINTGILTSLYRIRSNATTTFVSASGGKKMQGSTANTLTTNTLPFYDNYYAAAQAGNTLYLGGSKDSILVSTNNGTNWLRKKAATPYLRGMAALNNGTTLYACGEQGIHLSSNSGNTWTQELSTPDWNDIFIVSDSKAWAVGNAGKIVTKTVGIDTASCRYQDSLQLVALYNATGGANWTNKWDLSKPINTWYGITTNTDGCVTKIEIGTNNLVGTIPNLKMNQLETLKLLENIGLTGGIPNFDLPNLKTLQLFRNYKLGGTLPAFDKLPNLVYLGLHESGLTGAIPNFNLPNLTYLLLNINQLSGAIPNFDKMPKLEQLIIGDNKFTNQSIPSFDKLPALKYIYLGGAELIGTIPNFNLANLEFLKLSGNKLTGEIPAFDKSPKLAELYLDKNQLRGCFTGSFNKFCSIKYNFSENSKLPWQGDFQRFCKGENPIGAACDDGDPTTTDDKIDASCLCKGKLPIDTASCRYQDSLQLWNWFAANNNPNSPTWKVNWAKGVSLDKWDGIELDGNGCVKTIQLNNKNLSGNLANFNFSQLQGLYLIDNQLNGNIPNFNLINLQFLNLNNNKFSGNIPDFSLPKLQFLGLESNQLNGNIPNFNLIELKTLSISNNQLSGSVPNFNQLPKLSGLNLGNNKLIGIVPNFDKLPLLESLSLGWNQLNGNIPNFDKLPALKYLSLEINKLSGSIPNFDKIPKLVHLSLSDNLLNGNIPNFDKLPLIKELLLTQNQLSGTIPSFNKLPNLEMLHLNNNQFYGCYSDSLKRLCPLGVSINYSKGYELSSNPRLPFQGDFKRFCNGEAQIGAPCDDGDPTTTDDKIDANCLCKGKLSIDPTSCRYQDSLQLVALYNATGGANWTNKWDLSKPMNGWYGISLNTQGCVDCIDLDGMPTCVYGFGNGNNLVGAIPDLKLQKLKIFSLANNPKIIGVIPNFSNLPNVEELYWFKTKVSGVIPNFNMPKLKTLVLRLNQLTGAIPTFDKLNSIESISLDRNQLTGAIPNIASTTLKSIDFSQNKLSGAIPDFDKMPNVQEIFLFSNKLTGGIPAALANLSKIQSLRLYNNQLEGCYPDEIKTLCSKLKFYKDTIYPYLGTGYNFINNPKLSFQGDFQRFCNGEAQTGAPCDDGNPDTKDDKIDENCTCKGIDTEDCITQFGDKIYNGLTPNGDGKNDYFDPLGDLISNGCPIDSNFAELRILNSTSDIIFRAVPYRKWYGTRNGEPESQPVATGTYYFFLTVQRQDGKIKQAKGKLLIREKP